jgi:hypothetical protein
MSYLSDELAILPQWEGRCNWLYLDNVQPIPNPTTGIGNLVSNLAAMQAMPWSCPNGSPATPAQIAAEWTRVKQMRGGLVASAYKSPIGLTLPDAAIDAMVNAKLLEFDADLPLIFPNYASFPDPAKTRLLDCAWNLGIGHAGPPSTGLRAYHHLIAALNADPPNFTLAAAECGRNTSQLAFAARNHWTAQGFEQAAQMASSPA